MSPWSFVSNSCCVKRTTILSDGSIIGVGPDNMLYWKQVLTSDWTQVPNSGYVSSVVPVWKMPSPKQVLLGIGMDHSFYVKYILTGSWQFISPGKAIDVILLPTGAFLQVGIDNYLYSCGSLPNCAKVPGSGSVKSIDLLSDQSTIVGVRMEGKLYTRNGVYGTWSLVQNSGTVVDITVMANGVLVGTGPDGYLYTRQTLTSVGLGVFV